jgi:aspartate/methionine/tyrosine aminotransferase
MNPVVVPPFHAIEISRLAHRLKGDLRSRGLELLHMEFGQPSAGAPAAALEAARRALETGPMGYWTSAALRERLARHYLDTYGLSIAPERIILTAGASAALLLLFNSLFARGDTLALTRPGYAPYRNAIDALGFERHEVPCGAASRWQITAAQVRELPATVKGLILVSPANPTGTMVSGPDLRDITRTCDERGIVLISDEIYHGISYGPRAHSALEFSERAIAVGSFSKDYCMPGWRLGWMVVPPDWARPLDDLGGNLFLTPSSLAQHAALAAMDARAELDAHLSTYTRNRQQIVASLEALGVRNIAPPDGAFYIYADVGAFTQDSLTFCRDLVTRTGLTIAPGVDFDTEEGQRFVRFSFAVSEGECEDAMRRFAGFVGG